MRNSAHYHPDAFDSSAANRPELNPSASTMGLPEIRLDDPTSNDLSIIAAQLVEAAHKARNGDREAAGVHIARAVELLQRKQSVGPRGPRGWPPTGARHSRRSAGLANATADRTCQRQACPKDSCQRARGAVWPKHEPLYSHVQAHVRRVALHLSAMAANRSGPGSLADDVQAANFDCFNLRHVRSVPFHALVPSRSRGDAALLAPHSKERLRAATDRACNPGSSWRRRASLLTPSVRAPWCERN